MTKITLNVDSLISFDEAATVLGASRATVYNLVDKNVLHVVAIGHGRYLLREELEIQKNKAKNVASPHDKEPSNSDSPAMALGWMIKKYCNKCERCGVSSSRRRILFHHKAYPIKNVNDFEILCKTCHAKEHGLGRVKQNKNEETGATATPVSQEVSGAGG